VRSTQSHENLWNNTKSITMKALLSAGWVFTNRFAGEPGK
jgi:hypothetical protein